MDEKTIEKIILERVIVPGWVTTRGVLKDPTGEMADEESKRVELVMKNLADKNQVKLWKLIMQDNGTELMVAARNGFELDKDLEARNAWAKAVPFQE
ncbi:MAG: hypothetical protein PHS86_07675 [Syntrophaceae bacterium]|nr:hypothetical protein [Syntrophaceae bacterium]